MANTDFLDRNLPVRRLLEQVTIPLDDILDQNARMVSWFSMVVGPSTRYPRRWINRRYISAWSHPVSHVARAMHTVGGSSGWVEAATGPVAEPLRAGRR